MMIPQTACVATLLLSFICLVLVSKNVLTSFVIVLNDEEKTPLFGRQLLLEKDNEPKNDMQPNTGSSTVLSFAVGKYDLISFEKFVGSLRKSGFTGNVIMVLSESDPKVLNYLQRNNVSVKLATPTNCTHAYDPKIHNADKEYEHCYHPYPELPIRYSRYPLFRDYLKECEQCTGPVLFTDFRDAFFQDDPFGDPDHTVTGLEVFEEPSALTTTHFFIDEPIKNCKGSSLEKPGTQLCSGTTIGTREAMLEYLGLMYQEMSSWMRDPKCCCTFAGGDQAIHNYLYYTGKLPFAKALPNREGVVSTLGWTGIQVTEGHLKSHKKTTNLTDHEIRAIGFRGSDDKFKWLGPAEYNHITDEEGYILQLDGSRARVVHQYDRFWSGFNSYLIWIGKRRGELW